MAAKLTILTHKTVIKLHLLAESCTICSSRVRRTVRKLLDTPSCVCVPNYGYWEQSKTVHRVAWHTTS